MTVDIYKLNIPSRLESVEHFLTSDRNKELILNFVDYCFSEGLGEHRILKYITTLKYIAQSLQIDFEEATESDIRQYISKLERSSQSQWKNMTIK
jgi:integrase/recombinase XerD